MLPGGDGSAEFHPFIRRLYKNVLNDRWLVAQAVAPQWDKKQFEQLVWPIAKSRYPAAKFTTEEFIQAIIADVQTKAKINPQRVYLLGWSSGGPPCYAAALSPRSSVAGAFIAMSVFKPDQMPALNGAKGKTFYLLQSPDDQVTPHSFAETAEKALAGAVRKSTSSALRRRPRLARRRVGHARRRRPVAGERGETGTVKPHLITANSPNTSPQRPARVFRSPLIPMANECTSCRRRRCLLVRRRFVHVRQ